MWALVMGDGRRLEPLGRSWDLGSHYLADSGLQNVNKVAAMQRRLLNDVQSPLPIGPSLVADLC